MLEIVDLIRIIPVRGRESGEYARAYRVQSTFTAKLALFKPKFKRARESSKSIDHQASNKREVISATKKQEFVENTCKTCELFVYLSMFHSNYAYQIQFRFGLEIGMSKRSQIDNNYNNSSNSILFRFSIQPLFS